MIKSVLHYSNLAGGVVSSSTTCHGGVSKGKLATLSINPHRGDKSSAMDENLQATAAEIGVQANKIIHLHQMHETHCLAVTDAFLRLPIAEQCEVEGGKGAIVTDCRNVYVGVHVTNCVPALFYDPVHHVIGAAHVGWRGTVQRVTQHTLRKVTELCGADPKELKAVVGSCTSLKSFEVDQEAYDAFSAVGFPIEHIVRMYEKWHINLPLYNQLQLEELGVPAANIFQSDICTYDNASDFFSARILKEGFGTICTGIALK